MKDWELEIEGLVKELKTDGKQGLSTKEASVRLEHFGENQLTRKKGKSWLGKFLEQFQDAMVIILLVAAGISFWVAILEGDRKGFFEPLLILLIVVLNALVGLYQENKAEKALEALKSMAASYARVLRDGTEQKMDARALVPGDVIRLEAGDFVPADARLLSSSYLKVEESALTGESLPVEKDARAQVPEGAPLGDRVNCVYSGCSIVYGTGTALVTETGMHTEMGRIAKLLEEEKEGKTPLQEKLASLGRNLGLLAIGICGVIFTLGILEGLPALEIFMTAVALAVSAIPEGLPVIVTVVLSIGVGRMARQNAIIKRLPAVETLGCTSVICSDKTGTLTQNQMTLVKAWADGEAEPELIRPHNSKKIMELLEYGALCCNGSISRQGEQEVHLGDPTETSIVAAALKNGMIKEELEEKHPRLGELPFDSERKLMSVIVKMPKGCRVITKGAFDMIVPHCVKGDIQKAGGTARNMGKEALRVLAVAYKDLEQLPGELTPESVERDLILLGLVGMIDPPRPEAKEAVELCKRAGIRPVMITGDHVETAAAIAKQLGILEEGQESVSGKELAAMPEKELASRIFQISVYARVSPQDKIRVVKAWQKKGQIVSMTGDGVNDAPALKAADIGCAMGITGTDVAKGAADMTLQDDNFATIVAAVREGRGIYSNIQKTVSFLLGTNIGEVLAVLFSMLIWKISPFLPMQLLWINLITDSMPAIALGMEPVEEGVMDVPPRPKQEGLFAHGLGLQVVLQGCMFAGLALAGFLLGCMVTEELTGGRTLAFLVLAYSQIAHAFNTRSTRSLFHLGFFTNSKLNLAVLSSAALMAVVLFIPPLAELFGLQMLPLWLYGVGFLLALVPLPVLEFTKCMKMIPGGR